MASRHPSTRGRAGSPRPRTQRERSNSLPIVEALGCSTPEAQLLLAEGHAARRSRRSRSQRNRSPHHESITTFNPRDYLNFLHRPSPTQTENLQAQATSPSGARNSHVRIPSSATGSSTSTVIPQTHNDTSLTDPSVTSLGNYSANLAQFIKAQLRSIPTYTPTDAPALPLSPRSCPDLSFHAQTPPDSPVPVSTSVLDKPRAIELPPLRPPMQSQFSAWSSADGDVEDLPIVPDLAPHSRNTTSSYSDALGYYEISGDTSYLFPSIPWDDSEGPGPVVATTFPDSSTLLASSPAGVLPSLSDEAYPSSGLSHSLVASSTPSATSSTTTLSYFDCKRPLLITPEMRDRVIAAVTPPVGHSKTLLAMSPWDGPAPANVHDVVVESQHRVHVDGLSFDMQRDFAMPSSIGMSC